MKYCEKCRKQIESEEEICPICGATLVDVQMMKAITSMNTKRQRLFLQ